MMIEQKNGFQIKTGYQKGLVGWVTRQHGENYAKEWNFGKFFECKVATELSNFMETYQPLNSQIWSLTKDSQFFGSITLDGSRAKKDGAHLRWFILDETVRGQGFGQLLLNCALGFARDRQFSSLYLWTLKGLEPAGTLYRSCGFELEESLLQSQWGPQVQEEKLRLKL
ncbi:GCN5-related N-acetyltransferase [Candidatus Terasakiella magnetica]|uniref:GCN5-related N-acetyltransferase n=1 Tax=Candidatus Terasakiella magnetica TaxID=1867952 RepID=A0A1C3RGN4_9PROT|nr:GNAT family N-acetyltransferase [Candidatus Terasakiella magnetica]SCA56362.1 GCN5-related N-acetyltransferase [Candidatus Terasakiella magnetica]